MIALDRRVRDVALVPQRDILERSLQVAAQHAREARQLLGLDRIPLVRHRARALLLAFAERLLDFTHLGALEVADLERERLDRRAERRARVHDLGVPVAGEHLRRRAPDCSPSRSHTYCSTRGSTFEYVPDRARQLPHRDDVARPQQALAIAVHLHGPQRELHAERRRLRVDAVRPPDHRRVAELARAGGDRTFESCRRGEDHVERARHLQRERGVDDIARRQPVVDPSARRRADPFLHDVDERGDVVIGDLLAFVHRGDVEAGALAHVRACSAGTTPSSAQASTASTSTSSHAAKRASSVNSSAISGGA